MKINGYIINISHRSVGPMHDPYSQELMSITNDGTCKSITLLECSLSMQTTVTLYDGNDVVAIVKTKDNMRVSGLGDTIKDFVGLSPTEAHEMYDHVPYERDPMGELSDYI